jgi:hypothetical protein
MRDAQPVTSPDVSLPLTDTETVKAALDRNAAERRLLSGLLKLCWKRDRLAGQGHHAIGTEAARGLSAVKLRTSPNDPAPPVPASGAVRESDSTAEGSNRDT